MARPKKKHEFDEDVENSVLNAYWSKEIFPCKSAREADNLEFESLVNMLECKRTEKDYDWMSDFFFPHLPSLINTDASNWASQYFPNRDFVEAKLEGGNPQNLKKCEAAKKCINGTLNNREIFHFHKYIRGRLINALAGQVYAVCYWQQKTVKELMGYDAGQPYIDEDGNEQRPEPVPVYEDRVVIDQFNYDIVDPRNVFTDMSYVYSPQQKKFVTIRCEKTYEDLKIDAEDRGYFNLHVVKELNPPAKTDTAQETFERNEPSPPYTDSKAYDVYMRFGKSWAVVKQRDANGYPSVIVPGYNADGEILDRAEYIETVSEFVVSGGTKVLIRFQPQGYVNSKGVPYRPILRGWCYIHPTKDIGLSDGKMNREIQVGINDCLNMAGDRTKLSTIPTLAANKYAVEDNPTIFFAPENVMEVMDPNADIKEFRISDDISGIMAMVSTFKQEGQTASAIYPTTMGELPEQASTTATAVAGAELRTNTRNNYKSLTFEYTFLIDLYWMILQMTYQYATEETALKLMGDSAADFDPDQQYTFTPVSSNIEIEYNKHKKIGFYDQAIGRIAGAIQTVPALLPVMSHMIRRQLELLGDEYPVIADMIEKLSGGQVNTEQGATSVPNLPAMESSNQNNLPVSLPEEAARMRGQMGGIY